MIREEYVMHSHKIQFISFASDEKEFVKRSFSELDVNNIKLWITYSYTNFKNNC